jgi:hypothetical protein
LIPLSQGFTTTYQDDKIQGAIDIFLICDAKLYLANEK